MAQLHGHADAWKQPPDFVRIRWDHGTFFGNVMVYGDTPAAECWALLPVEVRSRFGAVAEDGRHHAARRRRQPHPRRSAPPQRTVPSRTGQADLLRRLRTGPRLYELAVALWELRDGPDYLAFREALLAGYRAHREIDVTHLDNFIAVRQVAFDLWQTGMAQVNPDFAANLEQVHQWSLAMLDLVESH